MCEGPNLGEREIQVSISAPSRTEPNRSHVPVGIRHVSGKERALATSDESNRGRRVDGRLRTSSSHGEVAKRTAHSKESNRGRCVDGRVRTSSRRGGDRRTAARSGH